MPDLFMAELFSLMPESASCENAPVAPTRSQSSIHFADLLQKDAVATGKISRNTCSANLCAHRETIGRYALEMTPDPDPASFRARAGTAYRVVLATVIGRDRAESRSRHLHTFLVECAKPPLSAAQALAGGLSPSQTGRKSRYQKDVRSEANRRNRQRLQGVYFLSH